MTTNLFWKNLYFLPRIVDLYGKVQLALSYRKEEPKNVLQIFIDTLKLTVSLFNIYLFIYYYCFPYCDECNVRKDFFI